MPIQGPVVITRPLAQGAALATQVSALGLQAVLFPLLEISALEDDGALRAALAQLESYALIAFVSPNAIAAAFAARAGWPAGLTLAVMGEGSRLELARHGMTPANADIVSPADGGRTDSQTLLEALDTDRLRNRRVLIVRGDSGRELLADALRGAGALVTQVAAYRRSAPLMDAARRSVLRGLLAAPATWIITSSEALRHLLAMCAGLEPDGDRGVDNSVVKLQRQQLLVPHQRILETARQLGFRNLTLTGSGDAALLAALQS